MLRQLIKLLMLVASVLAGGYGLYRYEQGRKSAEVVELRQINQRLEARARHLQDFITRLSAEKRRAEVVVTEQVKIGSVVETTTLMFVEYDRNGNRMAPKFFTIRGSRAHIDALVVKFDRSYIENDDRLRGHSIVLFYRIFGDDQAPAKGFAIDDPNSPPPVYRADGALDEEAAAFEAAFWKDFWKLADDPKACAEKGVRVIQGESPWRHFNPNQIYELALEAGGGLSIKARPMDGLMRDFQEAMKERKK